MKKQIFIGILLSTITLYAGEPTEQNLEKITIATPVEKIIPKSYDDFNSYEKDAMDLMMSTNSKIFLSDDAGNNFVVYMIPHHEGAIITSTGILKFTKDERVKKLAENIIQSQEKEVKLQQEILASNDLQGNDIKDFKDEMEKIMHHMMMEMPMASKPLTNSKDATIAYLTNMIYHHKGAVQMAQAYLKVGKNPELINLCKDIISSQEAQIKEMKNILKEYKSPIPNIN
ncbi:DUF305 domain-containing protein [Cetobacterium sp. SF1]|uniref:DUF305 domain-containing protein n=1 Tax=Cetobacterium sp. SF1 TaxID=3417654 RepID=UPI003CEF3A0F